VSRRLALLFVPLCAACFLGGANGSTPDAGNDAPAIPDGGTTIHGSWTQHVMHRLTRAEYDNTARDLLGEPKSVANQLPDDQESALGYDNDGIALVTSPLLVEQYFNVAQELIANLFARFRPYTQGFVVVEEPNFGQPCQSVALGQICGNDAAAWWQGNASTGIWGIRPNLPAQPNEMMADKIPVTLGGTYRLSVTAFATPDTGCANGTCTVKIDLGIDSSDQIFDVTNVKPATPQVLQYSTTLAAGMHVIRISSLFIDDTKNPNSEYDRTAWIGNIHLDLVPVATTGLQASAILDCGGAPADSDECTTNVLARFLPRAWRRSVGAAEIASVKSVSDSITNSTTEPGTTDDKWMLGMELAMEEALTSSNFVYRPELDADPNASAPHAITDYELATRLSYFLWSSMPDDELLAHAKGATLHTPRVLDGEVERMLSDPKAVALADDFAGQWLETRLLQTVTPSATLFPAFDANVRASMGEETRRFFLDFLAPGKKFPDMMDAQYTFTDATLRGYYGLQPSIAPDFTPTDLAGSHRKGILGQGSILTITSQPIRTSPVERGKFVLSRLLCNEPPPPPPNVPPLDTSPQSGSMRQKLEAHVKAGPACSGCHDLLDPIGLALESFDAVGRWRTMDGVYPIDTTNLAYNGHAVSDVATLAAVVKSDPGFVPCVSSQFWAYAMGQEAQDGDAQTIAALDVAASKNGYSLRDMIHIVVKSAAFQTRAGGGP
jgi:hypothetical protein